LCPIEDESPLLWDENQIVLHLYMQAMQTSKSVNGEDKDIFYIQPSDIDTLMNFSQVEEDDKKEIMDRVMIIQGIANDQRPNRPKSRK